MTAEEHGDAMPDVTPDAEGKVPVGVCLPSPVYSHSPDNHTRNICPGEIRNYRKIQRKEKSPKSRHPKPGRGETAMHLLDPSMHVFTYALVGTI